MTERDVSSKPNCLIVLSNEKQGIVARELYQIYTSISKDMLVHFATPLGGTLVISGIDDDYTVKEYFSKLSTLTSLPLDVIEPSNYQTLFIPSINGALVDLISNARMGHLIESMISENKVICAVGFGVAVLLSAKSHKPTDCKESDGVWVMNERSITGPTIQESIQMNSNYGNGRHPFLIENQIRYEGGNFVSNSDPTKVHIVIDDNIITAQNVQSYTCVLRVFQMVVKSRIST